MGGGRLVGGRGRGGYLHGLLFCLGLSALIRRLGATAEARQPQLEEIHTHVGDALGEVGG